MIILGCTVIWKMSFEIFEYFVNILLPRIECFNFLFLFLINGKRRQFHDIIFEILKKDFRTRSNYLFGYRMKDLIRFFFFLSFFRYFF